LDYNLLQQYIDAGLRIIPLNSDKIPPHSFSWRVRVMTAEGMKDYAEYPFVGIVCGTESGNLEVIDIDTKHDDSGGMYEDFQQMIMDVDEELINKLLIQKTLSGGYHYIYRCETVGRNTKLAKKAKVDGKVGDVILETRGIGGYIVAYPSPGYSLINHDFCNIPTITLDERNFLFACARSFDEVTVEVEEPKEVKAARSEYTSGKSPFDDYNERGDVQTIITTHGWKYVFTSGRNAFYKREGSNNKYGSNYHLDKRVFYVFSSSTEFEAEKGYSPVQVYCKLIHNDDWKACGRDLLRQGFGERGTKTLLSDPFAREKEPVDPKKYILAKNSDDTKITEQRKGLIRMGVPFGYKELDKHFVYKQGNFVSFNGFPGVGKTTTILWLLFLLAKLYDLKILVYTAENETEDMRVDLIEYYAGFKIDLMTDALFEKSHAWVMEHFDFLDNTRNYTASEFLELIENNTVHYDIIFADPYSAFIVGSGDWNYHVDIKNRINTWKKRTKISIWISHHCTVGAARTKDKKTGFSMPPMIADSENGAMWWAGSDDWITIHRNSHDPDNWMWSELHVRKIKRNKTGGRVTELDSPVMLRLMPGGMEYQSAFGERPHVTGIADEKIDVYSQAKIFDAPQSFYEVDNEKLPNDPPF
jgi:hypothetical protein